MSTIYSTNNIEIGVAPLLLCCINLRCLFQQQINHKHLEKSVIGHLKYLNVLEQHLVSA